MIGTLLGGAAGLVASGSSRRASARRPGTSGPDAAGTAATPASASAAPAAPRAETHPEWTPAATDWSLIAPLERGALLGLGWRVHDLRPVERGAPVLVLRHDDDGREARVHLRKNGGRPTGVAHNSALDFVLLTGARAGAAGHRTDEELGRVLLGLADRLERA